MIVVDLLFLVAALQTGGEIIGGVGRKFRSEQIDRNGKVEVEIALDGVEIDAAMGRDILRFMRLHQFAGPLNDALNTGVADEHMVRFFGQHEAAGARQGVECRFGEGGQLIFAVAIGEEGEHEIGQPIRRMFVEGAKNARPIDVARAPFQEPLGFFAPVAAKMRVQQIGHGPQVPAFFDVDLKEVAQIVKRRAGEAEHALLLDARRFGIALRHDQAAQRRAVFARHVLPHRVALVCTERDAPVGLRLGEENAPAIFRHFDIAKIRPAVGFD